VLPPFLRFVRGVIDCADIPLSISREHMQDSALISRIKTVMTNRVIRWLGDEAKKDDGKAYVTPPRVCCCRARVTPATATTTCFGRSLDDM
jgi:HSP90 family molecular chaperone